MAASSCAVSHCSPAPALPALPRAPIAPAQTLRGLPTEAGGGIASSLHPSEPLRGPSPIYHCLPGALRGTGHGMALAYLCDAESPALHLPASLDLKAGAGPAALRL